MRRVQEIKKKRGRPRKQDAIIDILPNLENACYECNGLGVYQAGFKYWKTCPVCRGKRYIEKED